MKRYLGFFLILCLIFGCCAAGENEIRFNYLYNDYYCVDGGTEVVITAEIDKNMVLGDRVIKAQLIGEDGTVYGEKSFDRKNRSRGFSVKVPADWTGTHNLAMYVDGVKCSNDFPVFIKVRQSVLRRIQTDEKVIAISIDCGAGGSYGAGQWMQLLEKYNGRATFFMTGRWAYEHPDAVRAVYEAGHEIGNHSYNHPHMETVKTLEKFKKELFDTNAIIEELVGVTPDLFRVPYGDWSYSINTVVRELGFREAVQWNIDTHDSIASRTVPNILMYATQKNIPAGSIVLFHCDNPSVKDMEKAFDYYVNTLGYRLVAVGDLLDMLPEGERYIDDNGVMYAE